MKAEVVGLADGVITPPGVVAAVEASGVAVMPMIVCVVGVPLKCELGAPRRGMITIPEKETTFTLCAQLTDPSSASMQKYVSSVVSGQWPSPTVPPVLSRFGACACTQN